MTTVQLVRVDSPPWVDIYVSGLPDGTAGLRVERVWQGQVVRVRGDLTTPILGGDARLVDWAAPVVETPGPDLTYRVTPVSGSGAPLEEPTSATTTPTLVAHSQVWVSDPFAPTGGVRVTALRGSNTGTWQAPAADAVSTIAGLPLGLGGARSWRSRTWMLLTETDAQDAALREAVAGGLVLLRGAPDCLDHPTGVVHAMAPSVTRARKRPHVPGVVWEMAGTETRGPAAPPAVAGRTYADGLEQNPTYQDSRGVFPTYLDRLRG